MQRTNALCSMPPRLTCLRLEPTDSPQDRLLSSILTLWGRWEHNSGDGGHNGRLQILALVFVERLDRDRLGLEIGLAQALPLAGQEQPVALQITRLRFVDGRVVGIDRDAFEVAFLVICPDRRASDVPRPAVVVAGHPGLDPPHRQAVVILGHMRQRPPAWAAWADLIGDLAPLALERRRRPGRMRWR